MNGCVVAELSRRSIACWYRIDESDSGPLSYGEGHSVPLYFRVDDSGVHMGESARRLFVKGERERAFGDYFRSARAGTAVRIFGNEVPTKELLFDAVEKYLEVFLRDHAKIREPLATQRKTIPLRFAFAMDLDADDRFLVLSLFKSGGYGDVEALDVPGTLRQAVLNEKKPQAGTAMVWLAALDEDVFLSYLPPGQGACTAPLKLGVSGADPRLNSLVEMLFLEATESTRMALNKVVETPVLEEAAKAMLIKGGARFSATITLADGDTTFEAAISAAEVEEKAKWNTAAQQILSGVDQLLSKLTKDKAQVICVLSGAGITTPYFERRVQDAFKQVISLTGPLAAAWRKEMFSAAGPKQIGFKQASTPPPAPVNVTPPPAPPPPPPDKYDVNAELARRKAEEERKRAELEKKYAFETGLGDHDFENGNWGAALDRYKAATALKPQEPYPLERARLCLEKIAKLASESKDRYEKYQEAIKQGDLAFKAWNFDRARRQYQLAKVALPTEQYPVDQLIEVERWIDKTRKGPQKWPATLFAILVGGIGAHRFYLNQIGLGILSLLFCWTGIPAVIGILNGLNFFFMGNARFLREYNRGVQRSNNGLIVMLSLLAVIGGGIYYLLSKTFKPFSSDYIAQAWFRGKGEQEWTLWDQTPGSAIAFKLRVEPPVVHWSVLSPTQWTIEVNAVLSPSVPGILQLGRFTGAEQRPAFSNHPPNGLQLCSELDQTLCIRLGSDVVGSPFMLLQMQDGNEHLFTSRSPAPADDPKLNVLNWANGMVMAGSVIRLGVFRDYACEEGCWANFSETRRGKAPPQAYFCPVPVFGEFDLSNGQVDGNGVFSNQRLIGQKFLFSTQLDELRDSTLGPAHVLTGLLKFSKDMMGPELQQLLDAAPEQSGGEAVMLEDAQSANSGTDPATYTGPEEGVFDLAAMQEQPEFPGGMEKMYDFLGRLQKYPDMEADAGIQGKVYVEFVILEDGTLSDVQVKKGVSTGLDQEALRLVKAMPNWNPGKMNGKAVRCRFVLPVQFTLG